MPRKKKAAKAAPRIDLYFETLHAYQRTAALKAAIELDLFTAIHEGATTAKAMAARRDCAERGVRILCDYLVTIGWLHKKGERYRLTSEGAAFLSRKSPHYLAQTIRFLLSEEQVQTFSNLTESVRRGGFAAERGTVEAGNVAPDNPVWVEFARSMMPMMGLPSELFASLLVPARTNAKWKVLDIAAGHGLYGLAVARHNPSAEIFALDWPNVLNVAEENAKAAGMSSRFHKIAGSAFEANFGENYDLVLVTNFLHHFDLFTCRKIMEKVHRALKPGGRAAILEFVPNPDRVTPVVPAQFSLMMLASTPTGDAYTQKELSAMLKQAGFRRVAAHALAPTFFTAVVAQK